MSNRPECGSMSFIHFLFDLYDDILLRIENAIKPLKRVFYYLPNSVDTPKSHDIAIKELKTRDIYSRPVLSNQNFL